MMDIIVAMAPNHKCLKCNDYNPTMIMEDMQIWMIYVFLEKQIGGESIRDELLKRRQKEEKFIQKLFSHIKNNQNDDFVEETVQKNIPDTH